MGGPPPAIKPPEPGGCQTRSAVAAEAGTHAAAFVDGLFRQAGPDTSVAGLRPSPPESVAMAQCADSAVAAAPGAPCGSAMHACHLREHGHPTIAPSLRTGAAIDGGAHTLSASTPVRAAPGGVAAPSPSAAAAGTVSRSPCARRSPGGATPAGGEAAALAEPKGLLGFESLRGQFIFVSGEWRQVRKVGPKQTSAAAVIFKLPNSAGKLPEEKWEVAPVLQVFDTAAILEALEYQKSDPSASWEHAVSEHARGVLGWMALNAASATPGSPCGGGPGGSGGGGGSAGGAEAEAGGGGVAGGGGLSASRPLGGGGAAGSGSAGAAQPDPPPPHPRGQTLAPSMPQSSLPPYTLITLYPRDTPTPTLEQVVALAPTRWCRSAWIR